VHGFLGVPPAEAVQRSYIVPLISRELGGISGQSLGILNSLYADDIRQTSKLTGLYLDDWLSPDYRDLTELAAL
jgi:hypothetical protein